MRAAWSSVPCPNTAQETKGKESSAAIHAGTVHTEHLEKAFLEDLQKLPKPIKSEELPNSNSTRMASSRDFNGVHYIMFHKNKPVVFTSACFQRGMCNALRNEAGAGMVLWTGLFHD